MARALAGRGRDVSRYTRTSRRQSAGPDGPRRSRALRNGAGRRWRCAAMHWSMREFRPGGGLHPVLVRQRRAGRRLPARAAEPDGADDTELWRATKDPGGGTALAPAMEAARSAAAGLQPRPGPLRWSHRRRDEAVGGGCRHRPAPSGAFRALPPASRCRRVDQAPAPGDDRVTAPCTPARPVGRVGCARADRLARGSACVTAAGNVTGPNRTALPHRTTTSQGPPPAA